MGRLENVEKGIEDQGKRIANLEVSPGVGEPPTGPSRFRMDDGSEASDERIAKLEERLDQTKLVTDALNERLMEAKRQFGDHKDDNHKDSSGLGKLVNLKDTNVEKLTDNISKGDFTGWVDELMMHLESATGWANTTPLLKAMRNEKNPLAGENLERVLNVVDADDNDFNKETFDTTVKNKELYRNVFPKLTTKLKTLVCSTKDTMNGFEMLRLVVRELDPVGDTTKVGLRHRFTNKPKTRCKDVGVDTRHVEGTRQDDRGVPRAHRGGHAPGTPGHRSPRSDGQHN